MLQLDLYRVFEDKGIENPHRYLRKNGFTPHTTSRLLNNKVDSISFRHLEQLCLLLHCSIDDIFNWKSDEKTSMHKDHPLNKIRRGERKGSITGKLKELSPDKLNEVRNYIDLLANNEKTT